MTIEDFKKLSEIYGAEISHWPKEHRDKLNKLSTTNFAEMRQILDEEAKTDALLASYSIAPASRDLFESIVASAPQAQENTWQQLSAWFNLKIAGVGLATAMAGALCVSVWTTNLTADNSTSTADNIDYGQDWIG
ncbi:MAG: hypothetical protein ACKVOA_03085 [Methylophilaceae bacterium]